MTASKYVTRKEFQRLDDRVKRIERELELADVVTTFNWKDFTERDKRILSALLKHGRRGATTTQIARELEIPRPETVGRAIAYRRLKRIAYVSRRLKGFPIVVCEKKVWSLNFRNFTFHVGERLCQGFEPKKLDEKKEARLGVQGIKS